MTAVAHKIDHGAVVQFPKKEQQVMSEQGDSFTKTLNYLVDDNHVALMTGSALKCYVVINRFTEGFNRKNWAMDSTFLQGKTGIKKPKTLTDSVYELEGMGLLQVVRASGRTNKFTIKHPLKEQQAKIASTPENGMDSTCQNGMDSTCQNGGTKKETLKENFKENIHTVFEFWKTTFGKTEKVLLSSKRSAKIEARLKQGYSVDDIKLAISNCAKSAYHVQNNYIDLELICRDEQKIDRFIEMTAGQSQPAGSNANRNVNDAWANQPQFTGHVEHIEIPEDFV